MDVSRAMKSTSIQLSITLVVPGTKPCRVCGAAKPPAEMIARKGAGNICKQCTRARLQRWQNENRERYDFRRWEHHLRKRYGISVEQYDAMLAVQDQRCAICRSPFSEAPRKLHVDHDHDSGLVRGILCYRCNTGLGVFRDCPERLRAAAEYLERSR